MYKRYCGGLGGRGLGGGGGRGLGGGGGGGLGGGGEFNSYVYVTGLGSFDPPRFAVSFRVSTPSRRILQPGAYKGRVCVIFIVLISVGARMTNGTVPTSAGLSYAIPVFVPSSNVDKDFAGGPPRSGTIPETTNGFTCAPTNSTSLMWRPIDELALTETSKV